MYIYVFVLCALVPDSIVLDILKERLCQLDCVTRGWVLHGYPRTREQAESLDKAGLRPNRLVLLYKHIVESGDLIL